MNSNEIDRLLSALAQNPNNPDLLTSIGNAFHRRGDLASALTYFARAINANPRHIGATQSHHIVLEQLGLIGTLYTNRFMGYYFLGKYYYTPLPDPRYIDAHRAALFDLSKDHYPQIDLNVDGQLDLFRRLIAFHDEMPFLGPQEKGRYRRENHQYSETDAAILYCMLRLKKPKRVIEIGSGFSSAVMLDANDKLQETGNSIHFTFIDPDFSRLRPLLRQGDSNHVMIENLAQNVDLAIFTTLEAGDVLFVDSSHVLKIGSDVNLLIGTVLPLLQNGVILHFHDIFHNFEYPSIWLDHGYAWNEVYTLKHFLMYNTAFKILFFTSFLLQRYADLMFEKMPIIKSQWDHGRWIEKMGGQKHDAPKAWMGASLWLVKE